MKTNRQFRQQDGGKCTEETTCIEIERKTNRTMHEKTTPTEIVSTPINKL